MTSAGFLNIDQIIERIAQEGRPASYSIRMTPPSYVKGTIEYLILVASEGGYVGYIMQFEPTAPGNSLFQDFTGIIRILDLDREVRSESFFEQGHQTTQGNKSGRTATLYEGCDCAYVFEPIYGPVTGTVIGHDVVIECECREAGGGDGDGSIGTPVGGSGPDSNGDSGGGTSIGGGGSGETIGFEDLPQCDMPGMTYNSAGECVTEAAAKAYDLKDRLGLPIAELTWLIGHPEETEEIYDFVTSRQNLADALLFAKEAIQAMVSGDPEELKAAMMTFYMANREWLGGPYNQDYFSHIDRYTEADLTIPNLQTVWMAHFSASCAILKSQNPTWPNYRIYYEASKEVVHLALDLGGLIPVVGEVFDLASGILYTLKGDGLNATLSYASAIPIVGWYTTGVKYAHKTVTLASGSKTTFKWIVDAEDAILFGHRQQLAHVLGTKGTGMHAHHIIPWDYATHPLVQQAAKSSREFHLNKALNGLPLPSSAHLTGHSLYNKKIREVLDEYHFDNPNLSDEAAYDFMEDFAVYLKGLMQAHPNKSLGQISTLIHF
jgi:hypothetical protein